MFIKMLFSLGMYVDDDDDQIPNSYSQVCKIKLVIFKICCDQPVIIEL